jgi:hypothetical protein
MILWRKLTEAPWKASKYMEINLLRGRKRVCITMVGLSTILRMPVTISLKARLTKLIVGAPQGKAMIARTQKKPKNMMENCEVPIV